MRVCVCVCVCVCACVCVCVLRMLKVIPFQVPMTLFVLLVAVAKEEFLLVLNSDSALSIQQ